VPQLPLPMNDQRDSGVALMNDRRNPRLVAVAGKTLARLRKQADGLRAELLRLRQTVAEVRRQFGGSQVAQLRDANEQLVLSALHAETIAETAVSHLSELAQSVQRDALTNMPNRALMLDRMESAIAFARRHATRIAVIFVDLDHFKLINDSLGHAVGDEVVKLVARRLEAAVRASDTVSRHGGDEFLLLLSEVANESGAAGVATKILAALAAPALVGVHSVRLSASLGIAIYPEDGDDSETLIRHADAAMYVAKRCGRDRLALHSEARSNDNFWEESTDGSPQHSHATSGPEFVVREAGLRSLREANEQLIISALATRELTLQARRAQHLQLELVASVARESHNSLGPVRTVADLIKRSRADEALSEHVQVIIKSQVTYMSRLLEDLLEATRVHRGVFPLACRTFDIVESIHRAVQACKPAMEARLQKFAIQLPPHPVRVSGNSMRLTQVISNLLDNASKYTGVGGAIALELAVFGNSLAVTVRDAGIGITPEALPGIFDLFVQEARALPLCNGGLGVGLAIVRDLVEAYGGTVVGASAGKDCGSEFVVTLPLADCTSQPG
jgi:diguanylate cyclase (GGDEF)-like protein